MFDSNAAMHSPNEFGEHLRAARKARGLTQAQAAARAGIGVRLWNESENGKRAQVGLETALRMLRAVGIELRPATQVVTASMSGEERNADNRMEGSSAPPPSPPTPPPASR